MPLGLLPDGHPFGISFTAEAYSEAKLLGFAHAYEQAFPKRTWPELG